MKSLPAGLVRLSGIWLLIAILLSCHDSDDIQVIRRIVNTTGYAVLIEIRNEDIVFEAHINPRDSIDLRGTCGTGSRQGLCDAGWVNNADFGKIIFDGNLEWTTSLVDPKPCEEKAINATLNGCYGYVRQEYREEGFVVYTYTITEADYENAEQVGG